MLKAYLPRAYLFTPCSRQIHTIQRIVSHPHPTPFPLTHVPKRSFWNQKPLDFDPKTNYYKVLDVSDKASASEIKNNYYRLA
jgi:hypothetical protein